MSNISSVYIKFLESVIDYYKLPSYCPKKSIFNIIKDTLRYKLAQSGIFLSENEKLLASFRNKHQYQRAFIIGNGPSLNRCNLKLLKSEITFGVNNIFLNYDNMGYYPTYYVVEDVLVAEDRAEEIISYDGSIKFIGNYLNYCIKKPVNTVWINVIMRYKQYPGFPHFSRDALRQMWAGGTVSYLCLQLAYYMGFSKIYLIGFDHSYEIPSNAKVSGNVITSSSDDPNHFTNSYFGKGYRWHNPYVERMEKAYTKAKTVYEDDNRKIYNATVGGKLEIFDRVSYSSLF